MEDLTDRRFGQLTVIKFMEYKYNHQLWLCRCDCGNERTATRNNLLKGHSWHCVDCSGWSRQALPEGEAAFNAIYGAYKRKAQKRGLIFSLTRAEFKKLTKQPCHYCGAEPAHVATPRGKARTGNYIYNGIDRLDNSMGYIVDNCVPCCKMCNFAKRDISVEDFKAWILRVANHIEITGYD